MSVWNKIKRYSGMSFGRPQVVGGAYYDRKIRNYIRSGYKSTRDPTRKQARSISSLSRKFGSRAGKYAGRKRFRSGRMKGGRRLRKFRSAMLYKSVLKHGLTQPAVEIDTRTGNIATIGDNLQGFCSWNAIAMETTPAIWDRILSASSNAAIASVSTSQQVYLDSVKNILTLRNNCNHVANIQVYKCYPRLDIPATVTVTGSNPSLFSTGFSDVQAESKATGKIVYTQYNATPYMSSTWCSAFKMKPIITRKLQPGQTVTLKHSRKVGYLIKKSSYCMPTVFSFATNFAHLRRNGPIYLVKVWGDLVHNETTVVYPLANGGLNPTTGGFNVDWLLNTRLSYRAPFVTPTRVNGYYNIPVANIPYVNEFQEVTDAPEETSVQA